MLLYSLLLVHSFLHPAQIEVVLLGIFHYRRCLLFVQAVACTDGVNIVGRCALHLEELAPHAAVYFVVAAFVISQAHLHAPFDVAC